MSLNLTYILFLLMTVAFLSCGKEKKQKTHPHFLETWDSITWIISATDPIAVQKATVQLDGENNSKESALRSSLASIESIHIPSRRSTGLKLQNAESETEHFAIVKISHLRKTPSLAEKEKRYKKLLDFFESFPGITHAAPSLRNKLHTFTEAELERYKAIEHMNTARIYETLKAITDNNVEFKYSIVIAVVDSGVDYEHPFLKDKMYVNPNETLNGIDDDNNGFTDDIHGIDASRPNKKPFLSNIAPGHDVGGPGATCIHKEDKSCGHGTHVSGIIVADLTKTQSELSNNLEDDTIPTGICQFCRILTVRVTDRVCKNKPEIENNSLTENDCPINEIVNGSISDEAQLRALGYIANLPSPEDKNSPLVNIVNMSLGKYFRSRPLEDAVKRLLNLGIMVIAAAGNDDSDARNYPAAFPGVIAVCATGSSPSKERGANGFSGRGIYNKADFSNFGVWVDICAPGAEIPSTFPGGVGFVRSGTSQATPIVTGAAALIWGNLLSVSAEPNPSVSSQEIQDRLLSMASGDKLYNIESADKNGPYSGTFRNDTSFFLLGSGLLDVHASLYSYRSGNNTSRKTGELSETFVSSEGCVVASTHYMQPTVRFNILLMFPFSLLYFILFLRLRSYFRKRKLLHKL